MLGLLLGVLPILIIVSVIITVHEFGHYGIARLFRTRIERFSLGFGKVLVSRVDRHGTEWCISALPLGGYVSFAGDNNISSMSPSREDLEAARAAITEREGAAAVKDYFHFKPLWQRFLIILAGPAMNFVLSITVFAVLFMIMGDPVGQPTVTQVFKDSPAAAAGFQPGDIIKTVDGRKVDTDEDVVAQISLRAETSFPVVVERGHQLVTLKTTPRRGEIASPESGQKVSGGVIGVVLLDRAVGQRVGPLKALQLGVNECWKVLDVTFTYVGRIFAGHENGDKLGGIIGMTKTAGDATAAVAAAPQPVGVKALYLILTYVQLIGYISVSIGFLNLLPVPMLDGGHLAFYLWQVVTRQPVSAAFQSFALRVAVVLIAGLMLFAAWNDINHLGLADLLKRPFS